MTNERCNAIVRVNSSFFIFLFRHARELDNDECRVRHVEFHSIFPSIPIEQRSGDFPSSPSSSLLHLSCVISRGNHRLCVCVRATFFFPLGPNSISRVNRRREKRTNSRWSVPLNKEEKLLASNWQTHRRRRRRIRIRIDRQRYDTE